MMINDVLGSGPKRDVRFRVGRGPGSGNGKTCGRGQHGYYSRSGAPIRLGFQGGTMRFFRRLPRRGFNNKNFKTVWAVLNVTMLEKHFEAGATVDVNAAIAKGLVRGDSERLKILGFGELKKALKLDAAVAVSAEARKKIEAAGGSVAMPLPKKRAPSAKEIEAKKKKAAPPAPEKAEKGEKPAKGEKAEKQEKAEKGERPAKGERPPKAEKGGGAAGGGEKAGKGERPPRAERPERPERTEKKPRDSAGDEAGGAKKKSDRPGGDGAGPKKK
jgi:large subunit ribosomal protein L15